jgi:hypothetical protein
MMEEGIEKQDGAGNFERVEIFSKVLRAGKRTYFFDVKTTRKNDYFLTITESKKRYNKNGQFFYEKHKMFLYKEDFDKFMDFLLESLDFIKSVKPEMFNEEHFEDANTEDYTNVEFEDLENVEATGPNSNEQS